MTIVDVKYQTREYFIGISQHQAESRVWIANEIPPRMCDISSQSIQKLMSKRSKE